MVRRAGADKEVVMAGIDLGGTKIAAGLVEFPGGRILAKEVIPTLPLRGGEAVASDMLDLATRLQVRASGLGKNIEGIGVGIAELVDLEGEIASDYLTRWRGPGVKEMLAQIAPTCIEADVRAAALAEALFGAGRKFENFVYVSVGTGISHTLVLGGRPYAGAHGNALMVASEPLTSVCEKCGTVQDQVLEKYAAGPSLVDRYNRRSGASLQRAEEVATAAAAGDPDAREVVVSAAKSLGNSVGFLINVLDPEAVVVGGGLGVSGGLYWDSFVLSTRGHIGSIVPNDLPILPAELGVDSGVIGAAATIWRQMDDR